MTDIKEVVGAWQEYLAEVDDWQSLVAGRIAVGSEVRSIAECDSIVTSPDTVHITLSNNQLVLAVVNTPPFNADNYVVVDQSEPVVSAAIAELKA
jgi:hypothetical protein